MDDYLVAPTCYGTLGAGKSMALMMIISIGQNRTVALQNAAEIDAEPASVFHGTFKLISDS
jgi:predicted exporter